MRQREGLRAVPENRLLLETDAPYLSVQPIRTNTPAYLGDVASLVAQHRRADLELVLETTLANAKRLY
jgi:TatD DNase family protein